MVAAWQARGWVAAPPGGSIPAAQPHFVVERTEYLESRLEGLLFLLPLLWAWGRVCADNKFAYATGVPDASRSSATPNPMVSFALQDISLKETFILFD
jgi:hypothetical protein